MITQCDIGITIVHCSTFRSTHGELSMFISVNGAIVYGLTAKTLFGLIQELYNNESKLKKLLGMAGLDEVKSFVGY